MTHYGLSKRKSYKYLLFVLECDKEESLGIWITSVEDNGNDTRNLVDCDSPVESPHWSPDGNFIVFESNRSGNDDIWLVDVYTLVLINLTLNNSNRP